MTDGKWVANCLAVCLSVDDACGPDVPISTSMISASKDRRPGGVEFTKPSPGTSRIRGTVDPVNE
ncbi:hypothetical protein [Lichenifustis flavocetrariae]|uniref:Uncharacterized protein n=1 Tax=Lichenifustis flavocetrariae TaxID=2949735 RepID=A0AA41ZAM9_9HYPH|nr:hypothetical protein [Lichenifustis flavocetrariae]MCW6512387.1 hypothetical protein [Lichenifustis flavocetrariae]